MKGLTFPIAEDDAIVAGSMKGDHPGANMALLGEANDGQRGIKGAPPSRVGSMNEDQVAAPGIAIFWVFKNGDQQLVLSNAVFVKAVDVVGVDPSCIHRFTFSNSIPVTVSENAAGVVAPSTMGFVVTG